METNSINPETVQILFDKVEDIRQLLLKEKKDYPLSERWLDIAEACMILNVSKRTLQNYRDKGILAYSQVSGKIYFKAADIDLHLKKHYQVVSVK
ncbi:MAG: hypothetical protein A2046_07150 [Bacteroidetes bacterium GWA2_30_7]|nr:MAG: hypothetical protein A2046_07150 [Bacteroidetes bacterium GWA2_30_7]